MKRHIILGVTGSIAATKSQSVCLALQHCGFEVRTAMTHSAQRVIQPAALSAVADTAPFFDMWAQQNVSGGEIHIAWAAWADGILIAPASASCIAALAHGFYDNCVSLLAANLPPDKWFIAPAMSEAMWQQPAVRQNVATLQGWGAHILGPRTGKVASGASGRRMLEPKELAQAVAQAFAAEPTSAATSE
jgi:phosphopantothenoylcysteine decarboxylase/phosphopantothenate--cysteine ligase